MIRRLIILLLIVGCGTEPEDVYGCTDNTACNFNPDATKSKGCEYIEDGCGICGGHSTGICIPSTKASLDTKALCESGGGFWMPNCD